MGTPGKLPFHADPPGDWIYDAACADKDQDLWFPDRFDPANEAKAICAGCPVRIDCLRYAIETHTTHGVWGGLTAHERQRRRGPGRKRKAS
jgi:WhiB family redox-sensing transcriptional regulator